MLEQLRIAWNRSKTYPKHLKRWKHFKMLASYPLTLVGLLFLIIPFFVSSNNFAAIANGNQNPLGTCQFNLDFTPGNEKNAEVIIPYRFHNPSASEVNHLKFTFTLKTQYTNTDGEVINATLLKGETPAHAVLPERSLYESYSAGFADANTDFFRKQCDEFYLNRDRYAEYHLYLDILIEFDILFEESDWIHLQDVFLNLTSAEDSQNEPYSSEKKETSQVHKNSINAAGMLVFVALFLTLTTIKKRKSPQVQVSDNSKLNGWLSKNSGRIKSLLYSSLLTGYFLYYRFQAIESANVELVQVLTPDSFQHYMNALTVSTAVLLISWFISLLPLLMPRLFKANSPQSAAKSLSISLLWLISASFWSSASLLSFDLGNLAVIRDRTISMWPSYAFLSVNLIIRIIDLFMVIGFASVFQSQLKKRKRESVKLNRKFLADAEKMKENVFHAAYKLNAPRATYNAIKSRLEARNQPLEYETGEKYQEEFLEYLITEGSIEKSLHNGKTIYRLHEQDIENDVQEPNSEKESEETSKNSNLLKLTENVLTAIEELNRPRASLNQLKHHFQKHSIPYKTKSGASLDRDFINRLLVNLELNRKKMTKDGNEYHVYLLTDKSLRFLERRGIISTIKDDFRQERRQQRNLEEITLSNDLSPENDASSLYDADTYLCPHCNDYACRPDWDTCPGCGASLISEHSSGIKSPIILQQPEQLGEDYLEQLKECPECGYHCQPDWKTCPECKYKFDKSEIKKIDSLPENEELDEIPEELAYVLGSDITDFEPYIDPHLPNAYCRSCGKKQPKGYEFALCKDCHAHFDPEEIVYCPNCGKSRRVLRKTKLLKRDKTSLFCLDCLQPFITAHERYQKYTIEGLYQKASNLDRNRKILTIVLFHVYFIINTLIFILGMIDMEIQWTNLMTIVYLGFFSFLFSYILLRYSKIKQERISRDEHYRIKIATIHFQRRRDKRETKKRYKFKDNSVNQMIEKSVTWQGRISVIKKIFLALLISGATTYIILPSVAPLILSITLWFSYPLMLKPDSRIIDKALHLGIINNVPVRNYEIYVRQVITTLKEEIR